MLAETRIEDDIKALYRQITVELDPKPQEEQESFYNTTRVKLNYRQKLIIREKEIKQISHLQFAELRK